MIIDLHSLLTNTMNLNPQTFSNQVIVVTGAGRGIGYQTARAFAHLGAKVVLAELSEQGLHAQNTIQAEGGIAHFVKTDVSSQVSVEQLVEQTNETYGPVDVLVNNAITIQQVKVIDMSTETWDHTIAVNLRGTFLTCRAFLPEMLERDCGVILNMISTDAMPGLSAYIASKQAITGFTQSLALELVQTGIKAIPFGPGMVDTPGIRSIASDLAPLLDLTTEQFLTLSLHADYDGLMPPEHAAAAAVYLTVHLAEEFNGQVVNGYEVLERAGVLKTRESLQPDPDITKKHRQADIKILFQQLSQILIETEAEFNKLPIFARPLARNGFKNKSGMSLTDWQRFTANLISGESAIPENMPRRLEALATYFSEVPMETARFTKDEATLKTVTKTAHSRLNIVQDLVSRIT